METRRPRAEPALAEVLERVSDAFFALDRDWRITYANSEAKRLGRVERDDVIGRTFQEVAPDFVGSVFEERYRYAFEHDEPVHFDAPFPAFDAWFEVSAYPDADGLSVFFRDISERKRAEQELRSSLGARVEAERALRTSEERYRQIVETSREGIWIVDADSRIVYANASAADLHGTTVEDLVGRDSRELVDPEQLDLLEAQIERRRRGHSDRYELRVRRSDGTMFDAVMSASPLPSDTGEYVGALVITSDVSERRRLEEEARQAQQMDAIGRLAGGVAHEFNNLLLVIEGYAALALGREPSDPALRDDLEQIAAAAQGAKTLTRQLLAFGRKQVLQPRLLDLNDVVAGTAKLVAPLIGEQVELARRLAPHLRAVRADPRQLEQVLINLVLNARDALAGAGRIVIETANVELDDDGGPAPYVALRVCDSGSGIDEETRSRLFEPFFTTKAAGAGSGLGLATVYGIVQQSGGRIEVESDVGRGACFTIQLPAADGSSVEPSAAAPPAVPATGRERVLLVEDEAQVRQVVRTMLERQGYEVLVAGHAEDALELAAREPVDLLVTDVVMPGISGVDLARRLTAVVPGLRVVLVTGYAREGLLDEEALAEFSTLLTKPFTPAELGQAVRAVLDAPGGGSGAATTVRP